MAPKKRAIRALAPLISDTTICFSCRRTLLAQIRPVQSNGTRSYASSSPAVAITENHSPETNTTPPPISSPKPTFAISAGVLLSRPPFLTRPLHPFEKSFFLYQKRLNERLALPFTQYFYFKKGTPANAEWKRKMKMRKTPARDIGAYQAYSELGWNDEVVIGTEDSKFAEEDTIRDVLVKDMQSSDNAEEGESSAEGKNIDTSLEKVSATPEEAEASAKNAAKRRAQEIEQPMSRMSEADINGDQKSLNRMGWRTLYLLVKEGGVKGRWLFPRSKLEGRESLRTAAERVMVQAAGINMNTWLVGNVPIGHYAFNHPAVKVDVEKGTKELGEKVFLLKGRIMAGQANLDDNKLGLSEFRWLAKEEIKELVTPSYWRQVENALAER